MGPQAAQRGALRPPTSKFHADRGGCSSLLLNFQRSRWASPGADKSFVSAKAPNLRHRRYRYNSRRFSSPELTFISCQPRTSEAAEKLGKGWTDGMFADASGPIGNIDEKTLTRKLRLASRERWHYCSVISTSIIPVSAASGCKALPTTAPTSRLRSVPFMA